MSATKFDICSRALVRVGAQPITSFDDGTAESDAAGTEYEQLVQSKLSTYRWRFAANQQLLNRLTNDPTGRWTYAFQLPTDCLVLHTITRAGYPIIYDRYADKIFTDEDDDLVADYTYRVDETKFPPLFVDALIDSMAAVFCASLAKDFGRADNLRKIAEEMSWPRAQTADSQQQTTRRLPAGSRLVRIRR